MTKALVETPAHVIEDTRMRSATGEYWTRCTCGDVSTAKDAEALAQAYAAHIAITKGGAR